MQRCRKEDRLFFDTRIGTRLFNWKKKKKHERPGARRAMVASKNIPCGLFILALSRRVYCSKFLRHPKPHPHVSPYNLGSLRPRFFIIALVESSSARSASATKE